MRLYLTLFLTLKAFKNYILGFFFPLKAMLLPDTYYTWLGNENIQTFLLIATYTSCEYTYGIFYLRQNTFHLQLCTQRLFPL